MCKFIKIGYEKPSSTFVFFIALLFILHTKTYENCITRRSHACSREPNAVDDEKKINFLLRWFFVFCLVIISFFIYSSPASAETARLMIAIEFRLSIFRYENLCARQIG